MSYSHSHRLVKGTVDWTLPQLMQVARYYGVKVTDLIAPLEDPGDNPSNTS